MALHVRNGWVDKIPKVRGEISRFFKENFVDSVSLGIPSMEFLLHVCHYRRLSLCQLSSFLRSWLK